MASTQKTYSRLDQLLTLLENGTTQATRSAAAKQLGMIQKKHPHELNILLKRLMIYVRHKEWETRVAGAEAIKSVASEVPQWSPNPLPEGAGIKQEPGSPAKLRISNINMNSIMNGAQLLLCSSGEEFESKSEVDLAEDLLKARRRIERKMGLTIGSNASLGVSSSDLFVDEDLKLYREDFTTKSTASPKKSEKPKAPCIDVMAQITEGMSSRERNRVKRKAKLLQKQTSVEAPRENETKPMKKKRKLDQQEQTDTQQEKDSKTDPNIWPFEWICEDLLTLLFSPTWEWRHGACLTLRDILNVHGAGAGITCGCTKARMSDDNNAWLEDAAVRMLCVMVLDRFGDFVSDQMVAPVRESCAQALAVTTKYLRNETVSEILNILVYLTKHEEWEVRHAGYLGIKYTLAVREDLRQENISRCLLPLINGLQDKDGDVRGVCADALNPIVKYLINTKGMENNLHHLTTVLCNSLYDLDELTASTQSLLTLLSKLISSLSTAQISSFMDVRSVMSLMWAFLKHSTPAVRKAALKTIEAILESLKAQQTIPWFSELVRDGLWSLTECCILEPDDDIQQMTIKVWCRFCEKTPQLALCEVCRHFFDDLMTLVAQPDNVPFPPEVLKSSFKAVAVQEEDKGEILRYIGGTPNRSKGECQESRSEAVARTRRNATKMLGILCGFMAHDYSQHQFIFQTVGVVCHRLLSNVNSRFALHRIVGCMVLFHWWESMVSKPPDETYSALLNALNDELYFNEISSLFIQVQSEIKTALQLALQHLKKPLLFQSKQVYSLEDALALHSELDVMLKGSHHTTLDDCNKRLSSIAKEAQDNNHALQRTVRSYLVLSLASASYRAPSNSVLSILQLPKINPIIRPVMEGLKEEENKVHRDAIAQSLTFLLDICRKREPCPNPKLIRNICLSLRGDDTVTPDLMDPVAKISDDVLSHCKCSRDEAVNQAILSLIRKHATSQFDNKKKNSDNNFLNSKLDGKESYEIARSGALNCLQRICQHFESHVFEALPQLWNMISAPLQTGEASSKENGSSNENDILQQKMTSLVILEALISILEEELVKTKVLDLLPNIFELIWCRYSAVRYVCSRCYAVLTKRIPSEMMEKFIIEILPSVESSELYNRMGVIEIIANMIDSLGPDILPYSVILIVPLLGRMSDHDTQVRLVATRCFASLMQYLPVESSVPDGPKLSQELTMKRDRDRRFLEQLLDSRSLDEYPIPVPIHAELRPYQEDGIKWMAFLIRYKLHGILCDDMGLGKTLQSICILASDHFHRKNLYKETKKSCYAPLPSLVICPPTLTGHWVDEVEKFCDSKHLNPLHYIGTPSERSRLQVRLPHHNLVIASYEVVRNDIYFFSKHTWNYCILDEGHMIRNAKNKLTVCVKSLRANHRLILSGTPIQNSVLELWSLFDFLMPGFLGSEQEFNSNYSKPILASRDAKSTSKEQEDGVMAMESLHKQVLPFMLRRMKEDVLQDLPPKIIQDYYCTLSPLQVRLYEDFSKTRAKREVDSSIAYADAEQAQTSRGSKTCHVFQALQYLQKVCNHPALVLNTCHPEYKTVAQELAKENTSLHDIQHSSKLLALMQLLLDCGIGAPGDGGLDSIVGQHRALIFCQHKSMLDIVEHDLLRKHMTSVTFLRLDGSVATNNRHNIVSKFNNDPSIDLLLLTTKVGGLGLNLTGADTVIFIEHDWNPTVDMQAMDRAHRIGQKRVVNVYRLITRGTLEEKIMSLQKFKINIANTIITADNSSLRSMETNQLLDLFTMSKAKKATTPSKDKSGKGFRALVDEIGDLWDQNQYDTEYNLDGFMEKLVS